MKIEPVLVTTAGGGEISPPVMVPIRQRFASDRLADPGMTARQAIASLRLGRLDGKRIAITAGSRRIANLPEILRETGRALRELGAIPFIVPAMGSHGGATAGGQAEMLYKLGITEQQTEMPCVSSMEAVQIGETAGGCAIFCDKSAMESDGIVVCARVKPHTSINAEIESGLCKMMVVGLGKHRGATAFHRQGYHKLAEILPQGADLYLKKAPLLCGLGIVENAYDETMHIEAVRPDDLICVEKRLLAMAKANMPRFLLDEIDVLVVGRVGKDISGAGMDPNITGRPVSPLPARAEVPVHCIVVLDLTKVSHGNATGIGAADITTRQLIEKIDLGATYTNVLTSGALGAARLPVILNNDRQAVLSAMRCAARTSIDQVRVVQILDTLHMTDIAVSENYLPQLQGRSEIEIAGVGTPMHFDADGRLQWGSY